MIDFNTLNDKQIQAVKAIDGAVLVLAGAGSGKTRVLTNRIAYMVSCGIDPRNILAITFTNKAANEMKTRLADFNCNSSFMTISTIHSMCAMILRVEATKLGYKPYFTIYDATDSEKTLKSIFAAKKIDDDKFKSRVSYHISQAKNFAMSPEQYRKEVATTDAETICEIYSEYEKNLHACNAMDFDDLLLNVYKLFSTDKTTLNKYQERYKYISIDEFQDTNKVQYDIFKMLSSKYGNLFVVGDDDQSIYGWRGADVSNILHFSDDFPTAKVFKLEQNYRSTKKILDAANVIISQNIDRHAKTLWTENDGGVRVESYTAYNESDEAYYVVQQIASLVRFNKMKYSDFAILMRINALSRVFEQECMKYAIPTKIYGGFKFFERKEIKDLTGYLRAVVNPYDNEALLRIINTPKRGIGDTTQAKLKELSVMHGLSIVQILEDEDNLECFNSGTRAKLRNFYGTYCILAQRVDKEDLVTFIKSVISVTHFRESLIETDADMERAVNIDEYIQSAIDFTKDNPEATLSEFLQSVSLVSDLDVSGGDDYVTISTIHSAKGLEFSTVFIVGLDDGLFPTSRAQYNESDMQEERRLMYVAMTRAKKRLYITRARSRFLYGERNDTLPSKYFKEVSEYVNPPTEKPTRYDDDGVPTTPLTITAKANPRVNTDIAKYKVGDVVMHKTFGKGIILNIVEGNGDVFFDGIGKKTLALKYAPLEIIKK